MSTFVGNTSGTMYRSTHQLLTSTDMFEKEVQWACFTKNAFMRAIGVEAFGVQAMTAPDKFATAASVGRVVEYDSGVYAKSGTLFAETGSSYHVGRMGTHTPQLVEGGDEWSYAWHELAATRYIPVNDLDDNGKGPIPLRMLREDEMKQKYVEDINYCFLGNSSAPDSGTMGPSSVYSDLPNLISVTQSRTVGGISKALTKWQNTAVEIPSVGSAGDYDLPIVMLRKMKAGMMTAQSYAEAAMDYLLLCTPGAWLYYDRIMSSDLRMAGQAGTLVTNKNYDAAGVMHFTFLGQPMVYDHAATVPYGATASTEAIYGIHLPSFGISFRTEKAFKFSGWEKPRTHDTTHAEVAQLLTRYTPFMRSMRPNVVFYNIPDNGDI